LGAKNNYKNDTVSRIFVNSSKNVELIIDNTSLNKISYFKYITFIRLNIDMITKTLKTLDNCLEDP